MAQSTKNSPPTSKQPARYADGGQPGLQPSMAIAYANGGSLDSRRKGTGGTGEGYSGGSLDQGGKGPWNGDLNADTTTFNQDYLRGANFGSGSTAGLITPLAPIGDMTTVGSHVGGGGGAQNSGAGGFNPGFGGLTNGQPTGETNPDGSVNLDAQGARIAGDLGSGAALGAGKFAAGMMGLSNVVGPALGAYNLFKDAQNQRVPEAMADAVGLANPALGALANAGISAYHSYDVGSQISPESNPISQTIQGYQIRNDADPIGAISNAVMSKDSQQAFRASELGAQNAESAGGGRSAGLAAAANAMPGDAMGNLMSNTNAFGTGGGGSDGNGGDGASGGSRAGDSSHGSGFADGGSIGLSTAPPAGPPGLAMPQQTQAPVSADPMHPALANLHVQNKLANPQVMQQIQQHLQQAIQAGQLNPQQLQMMGQLAQSAIQHPELWPKLRQFAIQAGLPDAQNLPMQFSQGIAMALMAAAQASQHGDRPGAFADGGMLHGPGSGTSDSIHAQNTSTGQPVKLSNHEYIIPADVVATKGKEFFDNLVRKYHTPAALQR